MTTTANLNRPVGIKEDYDAEGIESPCRRLGQGRKYGLSSGCQGKYHYGMVEPNFHDPWAGLDPQMESMVRLGENRLGLRLRLSSGERVTMPLGQASFHMRTDRVWTQPRKATPPTD